MSLHRSEFHCVRVASLIVIEFVPTIEKQLTIQIQ